LPADWQKYRMGVPDGAPQSPLISFDRTDVLYSFSGRRGVQAITYRWISANAPVDRYEAVAWYFSDPAAPVAILALASCSVAGPLRDLPLEGDR